MWFAVAIFYTYGDFFLEISKGNQDLHYMVKWMQYSPSVAFMLYSATFVLTIATMQVGHVKFQLNQLCWTIVVICLTVGNLKYISEFVVVVVIVVVLYSDAYEAFGAHSAIASLLRSQCTIYSMVSFGLLCPFSWS
jgi:hypothetical protein